jgi:hypothetical protein
MILVYLKDLEFNLILKIQGSTTIWSMELYYTQFTDIMTKIPQMSKLSHSIDTARIL